LEESPIEAAKRLARIIDARWIEIQSEAMAIANDPHQCKQIACGLPRTIARGDRIGKNAAVGGANGLRRRKLNAAPRRCDSESAGAGFDLHCARRPEAVAGYFHGQRREPFLCPGAGGERRRAELAVAESMAVDDYRKSAGRSIRRRRKENMKRHRHDCI